MFADGQFYTVSGKAQFIAVTPRSPVNLPDAKFPLILNTGRLRDQWHTMTRTALSAKLNQHKPEPFVEVHQLDAQTYGLLANSLASIESIWGAMLARVQITDSQIQGNLFVPMHWTDQYASRGRMGALVNPVVDPLSKQPESKHTPVLIKPYLPVWYGFILSRRELTRVDADYWVKSKGEQFYRYELAGEQLAENWRNWAQVLLGDTINDESDWQEYQDAGLGHYRFAHIVDGCLESVIFIAAQNNLPGRSWLAGLFSKTQLDKQDRKALLTGVPPMGIPDVGAIVCACFNVGEKTIQTAIKEQNLKTVQEVGRCLKAGTNCGSCVPEIKALL
jgi:assimilatory nitrate reductase catalytic subunit